MRSALSLAAALIGCGGLSAAPADTISSRSTHNLRVGGEPVFLVGYFASGTFDHTHRCSMVDEMATSGFNVMHASDHNSTTASYRSFLDHAAAKGISVLHSIGTDVADISRYGDKPAVIGWYQDDVQFLGLPFARNLHQQISSADPTRVDFFSVGGAGNHDYYRIADLGQRQYYPVQAGVDWQQEKQAAFWKLKQVVEYCRNSGNRVPQVALQSAKHQDGGQFPSATQIDLLSYLAVVTGMQGIMYWEFEDNSKPGVQFVRDTQPKFYDKTKQIAAEVSAMGWVYTAYAASLVSTAHSKNVFSGTWRGGDRSYLVTVNVGETAEAVSVTMPEGTTGTLRKQFLERPGALTYDPATNAVSGTLPPASVSVSKVY